MKLELRHTADGSATFYIPEMDEQYHSINGASTESKHVFIEKGFNFIQSSNPVILEIGFGTGLNALLTAHFAAISKRNVFFITVDNYPLAKNRVEQLNYEEMLPEREQFLFKSIHECRWDEPVQLTAEFRLLKIKADITKHDWKPPLGYNLIYFDAFGPDKQPDMWSHEIFKKLYDHLQHEGVLVTYSAKGEVRRKLNAAGFTTERLPGPPGKKEMLRAIKLV